MEPLQSLSATSHDSAIGGGALHSPHAPALHVCVPAPHALSHDCVSSSSLDPSQSSSRPLHDSLPGAPGKHCDGTPPSQPATLTSQMPTPHVMSGTSSSTLPSPSSSRPLQTSPPAVGSLSLPSVDGSTVGSLGSVLCE